MLCACRPFEFVSKILLRVLIRPKNLFDFILLVIIEICDSYMYLSLYFFFLLIHLMTNSWRVALLRYFENWIKIKTLDFIPKYRYNEISLHLPFSREMFHRFVVPLAIIIGWRSKMRNSYMDLIHLFIHYKELPILIIIRRNHRLFCFILYFRFKFICLFIWNS